MIHNHNVPRFLLFFCGRQNSAQWRHGRTCSTAQIVVRVQVVADTGMSHSLQSLRQRVTVERERAADGGGGGGGGSYLSIVLQITALWIDEADMNNNINMNEM